MPTFDLEERLLLAAKSPIFRQNGQSPKGLAPREFSHDDGAQSGLFLGGIGCPTFSRDLDGFFGRWHLHPGIHLSHKMEEAGFLVAYQEIGEEALPPRVFALDQRAIDGNAALGKTHDFAAHLPASLCAPMPHLTRTVSLLFPFLYETYESPNLPFRLVLESFSPMLPKSDAAALPISFFKIHLIPKRACHVAILWTWPHLVGWQQGWQTTCDRGGVPFPAQYSAGNLAEAGFHTRTEYENTISVRQRRNLERPVSRAHEGEHLLFASSQSSSVHFSCEREVKAHGNRIGKPIQEQAHTLAWARAFFAQHMRLPETNLSWVAHWDEAIASAIAARATLLDKPVCIDFGLVMDEPFVTFGKGRTWARRYTRDFGTSGKNAQAIAKHALTHLDAWQAEMFGFQKTHLQKHEKTLGTALSLGLLNELYFLGGGGSIWVDRQKEDDSFTTPRLGDGEHFGFLEGFDVGYYYYNTLDLWVYAYPALSQHFPQLAKNIFDDYLKTADVVMTEERMMYREGEMRPMMRAGKLPHDLGAAPEDPWHDVNGYQMRDDSNAWIDHNPTFLISFFHHLALQKTTLSKANWAQVQKIAHFMRAQSLGEKGQGGLPLHRAFGDSTWDNIGLSGLCTHSACATLAALSALRFWAEAFDDLPYAKSLSIWQEEALDTFSLLWAGDFYRAASNGTYQNCLMPDALMWAMYAEKSGLPSFLDPKRVTTHLKTAFEIAYQKYGHHAPLLICAKNQADFPADGGDIGLQVNEVILGAAWAFIAHCFHAGLTKEARLMSDDMIRFLQRDSGLQQRSPAAWDKQGRFRAPLNMRPLAIWLCATP